MSATALTHLFIDFDETLFNHDAYANWLENELNQRSRLPKGKGSFVNSLDNYHVTLMKSPSMRLYRHAEHMKDVSGQDWDFMSGEIEKLIHLQKKDFCYEDAHVFLEWLAKQSLDVRILTFGDGEYQRFKIRSCSYLRHSPMPIHVTYELKRDFLDQNFGRVKGVLVDDKKPLNLPKSWQHIWINRHQKLNGPKPISAKLLQISSLSQVPTSITP